ncbi:MAG: undecaprenyl-diphosphate phosphatase, partial [Candidatus Omnitrophica bacterium]|nr:undecaprenyl-diphosphate phosphatase [Candidatus Omnitrophota bacterium]
EHPLVFDIILHSATFFAIAFYFRKEWIGIIREGILNLRAGYSSAGHDDSRTLLKIIVASVPILLVGFLYGEKIEYSCRDPFMIALTLGLFGLFLYLAELRGRKDGSMQSITLQAAFIIGLAQVFALMPGVSRSGVTITAALMLGLNRESSVKFSFLLGAPIILSASLYSLKEFGQLCRTISPAALLLGFLAAFISSLITIHFLLTFVRRHSFAPFCLYRIALSLIILFV